ncbi:MAG: S24 family peptidase [Planctomycetes bacterium]|nr:S24 family peptidase [Planctomycetota bacterium]
MPVVESYTYEVRGCGVRCDVDALESLVVDHEPTAVFMAATRGYRDTQSAVGPSDVVEQNREQFYAQVRVQQVLFRLAHGIVDDLVQGFSHHQNQAIEKALLARHQLFPQILQIVEEYVRTKVTFAPGVDARELALETYSSRLRERVRSAVIPAAGGASLLPVVNSYCPAVSTASVNYATTRPILKLNKSHLNAAVPRSTWENEAIMMLEGFEFVDCFAPNDRQVGFQVIYEYQGGPHLYEPDFLVRLRGGLLVLLEIKGPGGEIHDEDRVKAKNDGARKWVDAVNNAMAYGTWVFEFCNDLSQLRSQLEQHVAPAALPFRLVEPTGENRFRTCVPFTTLRAAAGQWSDEQIPLDTQGEWATEWAEFVPMAPFERGMFVAQVQGDSMAPEVPDLAYCLFRVPRAGSRQGRRLLVWHAGRDDPHTGGCYTLKVYTSEKASREDGWEHTRIVLSPLNPAYDPIVLTPEAEGEVGVIAELVQVLATPVDPSQSGASATE